ncbi:uncharacterized protein LOC117181788 [Belonocnema kinseyi]|uniref:uncharacterized protein LOC117181788 n=1 Tax=Belonocnema kinseyi TaxID=2817044 RepID=UPI00143D2C31|nr:uncharacterized protein LOC117181788 [Belonocnema kinseyi]
MDASLLSCCLGKNEAKILPSVAESSLLINIPTHSSFNSTEISNDLALLTPELDTKSQLCTLYLPNNKNNNHDEGIVKTENCLQKNALTFSSSSTYSLNLDQHNSSSKYSLVPLENAINSNSFCRLKINTNNSETNINSCNIRVGHSSRSISSPQLMAKPPLRSKVYRKASLKSAINIPSLDSVCFSDTRIINISNRAKLQAENKRTLSTSEGKVIENNSLNDFEVTSDILVKNVNNVMCDPSSTPYPYSMSCNKGAQTIETEAQDDEPKNHSCGSFLPILSLIPHSVISFQYLSPKMKFSWWRNKIS